MMTKNIDRYRDRDTAIAGYQEDPVKVRYGGGIRRVVANTDTDIPAGYPKNTLQGRAYSWIQWNTAGYTVDLCLCAKWLYIN